MELSKPTVTYFPNVHRSNVKFNVFAIENKLYDLRDFIKPKINLNILPHKKQSFYLKYFIAS